VSQYYFIEKEAKLRQEAILADRRGQQLYVGFSSSFPRIWAWLRQRLGSVQCQIVAWAQYLWPEAGAVGVAPLAQGSTGPCNET
jgi:hypothetical protein